MDDTRMKITLLLTAALCLLAPAVISADKDAGDVDQARTTLKKWVETRRIISQEKRDWALGREVLNGRIDLVQREIDAQRDKIGETEASIAEVYHQRAELIEENEQLKAASEALSSILVGLEARTTELLQRLPNAIRVHVRPLSQRLPKRPPDNPNDTKARSAIFSMRRRAARQSKRALFSSRRCARPKSPPLHAICA